VAVTEQVEQQIAAQIWCLKSTDGRWLIGAQVAKSLLEHSRVSALACSRPLLSITQEIGEENHVELRAQS
jgi:hypothetical protein